MGIWDQLVEAARAMTALEVAGVAFNLACVILTIRRSVWCWPVGIVGIALFGILFFRARLYPDMLLQAYFLVLSVYGWWNWARRPKEEADEPLVVLRPSRRTLVLSLVAIAVVAPVQGWLWERFSDAAVPYADSTIMVASVVAQWMLARKWLENWALWIAVDALAAPVYFSRGLYLLAALYLVFFGLAIAGFVKWRRAWRKTASPAPGAAPVPAAGA